MVDIGNGERAAGQIVNRDMEVNLSNSVQNAKQPTTKTAAPKRARKPQPALTPADSLSMLRSAIGYVMQSGLTVGASNHGARLVIVVDGANLDDAHSRFVPVTERADVPVMAQNE